MTLKPILDLALQHSQRTFGDITAIFTWNLHTDRPCCALVPTYTPRHHERITPFVVSVDMAFEWDEATGDPAYAAHATYRACNALGMNPSPTLQVRIFNIINDCLSDLLRMPNAPRFSEGEVVADAIARDPETGKTIHEAEVIDHV